MTGYRFERVTALLRDEGERSYVRIILDGPEILDSWGTPLTSAGKRVLVAGWGDALDGVGEIFTNDGGREIVVPQRFVRRT